MECESDRTISDSEEEDPPDSKAELRRVNGRLCYLSGEFRIYPDTGQVYHRSGTLRETTDRFKGLSESKFLELAKEYEENHT